MPPKAAHSTVLERLGHFHVRERLQLYYAAAPKPGTRTQFPEELSAKYRRETIPWGLKWTLMAPRERKFAPQGHKMLGFG